MADHWRFIPEESWNAPLNMALDVAAAQSIHNGGPPTIRIYRCKPSSISIGYAQRSTCINWEYCSKQNIPVVRRQTGGGGIFHDYVGDISYSIIAPVSSFPTDVSKSYRAMLDPIISTFKELGVSAELAGSASPALYAPSCYLREIHPAHDILVSGKKISGNAQRRSNDVVIQHGSLTYKYDVDQFALVFSDFDINPDTIRDHVTSISEQTDLTREDSIDVLTNSFLTWSNAESGTWTPLELKQAEKIAQELFSSENWTNRT
ncbi:MAG: lipoate--protein ligase family protein [Halobacteriales archaeon]|nr:lipoate--protein ligase family protein [Halobacteriales archaeon]